MFDGNKLGQKILDYWLLFVVALMIISGTIFQFLYEIRWFILIVVAIGFLIYLVRTNEDW